MADREIKNEKKFKEVLQTFDPELYALWDLIRNTQVSYYVVAKQILALDRVMRAGGGFGKVITGIQNGNVDTIQTQLMERIEGVIIKDY